MHAQLTNATPHTLSSSTPPTQMALLIDELHSMAAIYSSQQFVLKQQLQQLVAKQSKCDN